jgi:hypothetical protein
MKNPFKRDFQNAVITGRTIEKISFEGNFQNEVISGRTRKSHLKGISRMHNQSDS